MRVVLSIFLVLSFLFGYSQNLRINELVASNSILLDEDGDTPDWIELYNYGSTSIDLSGWTLSDEFQDSAKWTFPDIQVPADGYLLLWASDKDRKEISYAHRITSEGDNWKYITPNSIVSNNWRNIDFDDSNWSTGMTGIGYGDGDDMTVVSSNTTAVFARKSFEISELDDIQELIFHMDFDDGFVAFINGVEIARVNIDPSLPDYDDFANSPIEATIYQGFSPERYDVTNFEDILVEGENVLAVQVHNNQPNSSDLSCLPFLSSMESTNSVDKPIPLLELREKYLHTNFKLSSSGETLYLYDNAQNFVDSLMYTSLPTDLSYGIDNQGELALFQNTTPGYANGMGLEGIIDDEIIFSTLGGPCIGCNTFPLILSGNPAGTEIRYTLDSSIPTEQSFLYSQPIIVNETTVVRARIFKTGYLPSRTQSETYLFDADHDLPIISLVTEPDNFFDQDSGIYVLGDDYQNGLPFFGANFWEDWEKDIHFSLYESDGSASYSFNGGTKIFGGWSRANEQRSLSIFARSRYGSSSIDYPLFESRPFDSYQSIVLRNSGNDFLSSNLRDGVLTQVLDYMRIETAAYKPTVTYLNGEYWGILNMREKINEHFLASRYNLDPDEIDILELDAEAVHGNASEYIQLRNIISGVNMANDQNYFLVSEYIDMDNLILYHLFQIYINNTDWPGNNIKFWNAPNRKWRWILYDTDFGLGRWNPNDYGNNTLSFALEANGPNWPNPPWSTELFRDLMVNETFEHKFINQFADEMNSTLLPERIRLLITEKANDIESEIPDHFERWGEASWIWNNTINQMRNWATQRPPFVKQHILNQFNLIAYHTIQIQNSQLDMGYVSINSLTIDEDSSWSGDYFQDVPITVTAIPRIGYQFIRWQGASSSTDPVLTIDMDESITLIPIFEEDDFNGNPVVINEINYNSNEDFDTGDWIEIHNATDNTIDLSGWTLKDDDDSHTFVFPQQSLFEAKDFLIITNDEIKFSNLLPEVDNRLGDLDFGLGQDGDQVRIYDQQGTLRDSVAYEDISPWPTEPDGEGPTLELLHPSLDNVLPESWANLHEYGSPGVSNIDDSSTNTLNQYSDISIWPNPAQEFIYISSREETNNAHSTIELYNSQGHLIHSLQERNLTSPFVLPISHLTAGAYLLKIRVADRIITKKWVKL